MNSPKSKGRNNKRGIKRKLDVESDENSEERVEKMARLKMEEVMTQARIRKCPSCATAVVKGGGCNMVHCACGEVFCYNCGSPVHRCRFSICRFHRRPSAQEAARRVLQRLRRRYPALAFQECTKLLAEESGEEGKQTSTSK